MDPELAKFLQEEETIFPGVDLTEDDRREEPCWSKYADFFPGSPFWDDLELEMMES